MNSEQQLIPADHPVYDACENGDFDAVEQFLDNGINIYAKAKDKASIIAHARCSGSFETYKLFFDRGYDPNHVAGGFNKTEVFFAAAMEDVRWLKLLIGHGGNVNHRSRNGLTPYHVAAAVGTRKHIELMKQAGADMTIVDDRNVNDFMRASLAGNFWYAEELLAAGRDINCRDCAGCTPLHLAAKSGMLDQVKWLLDHGGDVHAKDVRNRTALFYAETNKHEKVVELLRQHGAE
jgi:ankyrin repeat protein